MSGLLKNIQRKFYARYEFKKATFRVPDSIGLTAKVGRWPRKKYADPIKHGIIVDNQITKQLVGFRQHQLPIQFFASKDFRKSYVGSGDTKKLCRGMRQDTEMWWQLMIKMKWTPVEAQVTVGHPSASIATAIDAVVLEPDGRRVLLENKTGKTSYIFDHTGNMMTAPFNKMTDCVHNQHVLQLAFGYWMYKHNNPTHVISALCIVYLTPEGAGVVRLPDWIMTTNLLPYLSRA